MADRHKAKHVTYETEEESRHALIEICVFLLFVSIVTYIAISLQTIYSFYFNRTLARLFSKRVSDGDEVKFEEIATIEEFWNFLVKTFFENLRENWESAESNENFTVRSFEARKALEDNKMLFLGQNLILEAPRLRQIRMKSEPCYKHDIFKNLYELCYGPYKAANELVQPEYKGSRFFHLGNNSVLPFWGNLERYYGAGYVTFLTYDRNYNEALVADLRDNDWIDRATRLVMIELVAYNNNMDLFNNMKFVAEIMPIGGIVSYSHMEVAPLFSVWSIQNPGVLAANIIFYAFIIFNTGNEVMEIYQLGLKTYLKSVWNYIDWGILLMAYFALALSILHSFFIDEYLEDVFSYRYERLSSIDKACHWFSIYVDSMACVAFLVWIRIFRFIGFNKTMLAFYLALKQCAQDIFGFAIIIFIVFMAFALMGLALFGGSDLDFSTFQYSYFFMMRLMLHDFEYTNFERSDPFWGELYFMSFIVVVIFLCFNMFLAIISQTYINVKKENIESQSAIKAVFLNFRQRLVDCFKMINNKLSSRKQQTPPITSGDFHSDDYRSDDFHSDDAERKPSEERVQRKIQFQEDESIGQPTISFVGTHTSRTSPREISEDEVMREFFGVTPASASLKRSVSQYSVSTFVTPESSFSEEDESEDKEDDDKDNGDDKIETESSGTDREEILEKVDYFGGIRERIDKLQKHTADLSDNLTEILNKLVELDRQQRASQE